MGRNARNFLALAGLVLFSNLPAFAADPTPDCLDGTQKLQVDDQKVLGWIQNTQKNFLARARVDGRISQLLPDQTGHAHFLIQLGPKPSDLIEVVYNDEFGALSHLAVGQEVEACGDYITTKNDPKLHAAAIIHWVHMSDNPGSHQSGYLKIDGLVYGLDLPANNQNHHPNHP